MMHLYVIARANEPELERWKQELLAQYLPFEYDKNKPKGELQVSVRPIQLFEIVFPEEHLEKVLGAVQPYDQRAGHWGDLLRRMLKLGKIRKKVPPNRFKQRHPHVSIIGIGVKRDRFINGIEEI